MVCGASSSPYDRGEGMEQQDQKIKKDEEVVIPDLPC
jgi:hypothetical protein